MRAGWIAAYAAGRYNSVMPYEWDEAKRQSNIAKHGIDFALIEEFDWATVKEERVVRDGDERIAAFGYIGSRLHMVAYAERGANIRIISLRKANPREMQRYAAP